MMDDIVPTGKWEFNGEVVNVFEDMLNRSIPGIENLRYDISKIISKVIPLGGCILDIGCSDGQQIESIQRLNSPSMPLKIYGVDNSREMIQKAVERCGTSVKFLNHDMCDGFPKFSGGPIKYDVILSVLTLQFIPVELRPEILWSIRSSLRTGGAFILVEKVIFESYEIQNLMTRVYHQIKSDNFYTDQQIQEKNKSLRNVLVSQTIKQNTDMLYGAGFKNVTTFWQDTAFVGWIAS
jgi:tRNA (cmo5U34)-methyltransferase